MITAVLDANVLYPAPLRDYLLHLAAVGLYKPAWTAQIQDEWTRNVLKDRPDLTKQQLDKTRKAMDGAFPDANIDNYAHIIGQVTLPDEDDRHVLAAAIAAQAPVIITQNLKDFPEEQLKTYDIEAMNADAFVQRMLSDNKPAALEALHNQIALLKNPPLSKEDVLDSLTKCGLVKSVKILAGGA